MIELNVTLLIQIISFLILVYFLNKLVFKPVSKVLDERRAVIDHSLDEAEKKLADAQSANEQQQLILRTAHEQARDILESEKDQAKEEAKRIIDEARQDGDGIRHKAHEQIEHDVQIAKQSLTSEVAKISAALTHSVIGRTLTDKDYELLLEDAKKKLVETKNG